MRAMVLFDMIGARDLVVRRDLSSKAWLTDLVWDAANRTGHGDTFVDQPFSVGGDDHMPFLAAGVPSVDIIDLQDYPQWHRAEDDLAHVSAASLQTVGDVALAALPSVERRVLTLAR
jgi:Zn-dependent M28 family amino/carboxypeptidase